MLFSCNFQLFNFIILILHFASSTSFEKENVKPLSPRDLNNNFIKIGEKFENVDKKFEQLLNSSAGHRAFDAVHEIITNFTRAIISSNKKLEDKFNEMEMKFEEKFNQLSHSLNARGGGGEIKPNANNNLPPTNICKNINYSSVEHGQNSSLNLCDHDYCQYGGTCIISSTGNDYACICPQIRSGLHCQDVKCTVENRCWRLNDTLYLAFQTGLKWPEARLKCEDEGMALAMPKDEETTQFLVKQYRPYFTTLWLGLKSVRYGRGWFWVDGSAVGSYTGGWTDMKNQTGPKFGTLYTRSGASQMWTYVNASSTGTNYPLCQMLLFN